MKNPVLLYLSISLFCSQVIVSKFKSCIFDIKQIREPWLVNRFGSYGIVASRNDHYDIVVKNI